MAEFFTILLNGLSQGGIYALIALGYTMVYGIAKMLNFAHGDIIMVGGYTVLVSLLSTGNVWVAIVLSMIICVVLGVVIERLAYKPLRGASPLAVLITAIGVSYLLESVAMIIFGAAPKMSPDLFKDLGNLFGGINNSTATTIVTLLVTVIIMIALTLFINFTKIGKAMLAVSEDKGAAQLVGINSNFIIMLTFAIGSLLAAVASIFYLMKTPQVNYTMGSMPGIKAFTAAVIGGIGSIPGAMLGGFLLGLIENFCYAIPGVGEYTIAIEFAILILILIFRPIGILGKFRREKV